MNASEDFKWKLSNYIYNKNYNFDRKKILKICDENQELDEKYNLRKCMGYLTKAHIEGIRKWGFSALHRRSFKIKCLN